jgi:hypothetical protein
MLDSRCIDGLRAAIEAAPYVHPSLKATASVSMGGSFAERLDKRLSGSPSQS